VAAVGNQVATTVLGWVEDLPGFRSIGLLGVSQGARIALQLLRLAPTRFHYLINLSGYVLPGQEPGDQVPRVLRPLAFWGRGRHDDVVPNEYVERTASWLPQHSRLTARVYDVGHTESDQELEEVGAFVVASTAR